MAKAKEPVDVFKHIEMREPDQCWPWLGPFGGRSDERRPYFQASGKRTMAYRWVYELYHGVELERNQLLLHSCDNGNFPVGCCNPHHLRIGSVQDNSDDMVTRDRHGLPTTVVRNIRQLLFEGKSQQHIAEIYGCSRETISAIATQRSHKERE